MIGMMPAAQSLGSHMGTGGIKPMHSPQIALHMPSLMPRRDDGGAINPTPGLQPSTANANPMVQNYVQRFSQMSPEQLQEMVARLGSSPLAGIAQKVLQQKRVMPTPAPYAQTAQPTPLSDPSQQQSPIAQPQAGMQPAQQAARGGEAKPGTVPILAAGGEFVISPEHVARLGDGDIKEGHRRLDKWVVDQRNQIIKTMSKLKPPVKS